MKEEYRNKKGALSDFERYVRGEMTKREENAFQRKLQRDPFTSEATEGFSEITPGEADNDMARLGKRLKNRIRPVRRVVFYRVAASIAVLMIVASAFLIIQKYKPFRRQSERTVAQSVPVKADPTPIEGPLVAETISEAAAEPPEAELAITDESKDESKSTTTETPVAEIAAFTDTTEPLALAEKRDSVAYIAADQVAVPAAAARMPDMQATDATRSETQPRPDSSAAELNEIVLVGYGRAKKAVADQTTYAAPQPVSGRSSFNRYVEENMRRPQSLPQGENAVAIVRFLVRSTGVIDSLRIVSSPGDEFSAEAMRLIREGPAWKPAEENGLPVDEEVQVRLVFR